jgi:hypothetical protein
MVWVRPWAAGGESLSRDLGKPRMSHLMANDLDDYTRFALPLILSRFPHWEAFATLQTRPDGAGQTVEFTIPCPSPAVEHGLFVSTADEELTVGFHTHHHHFTDYETRRNRETIEAGLGYCAAIVEDRVGVLSYYHAGEFAGSRSAELPHSGPLPGLLDGMGSFADLAGPLSACDRVTLRSWSGRFDRDG